ncbi:GntR family transcriptional regulator [uncultured Faecalibaculum sp.]|uniref:GntR family transcriptional regulator n=1 Tax=uncultured Faecalibaculum sp. TaxID=1729681 RepID=UPI00261ECECA|nr:GntR family transcriptional regulator [uncultured Faecalibaculum sp.]
MKTKYRTIYDDTKEKILNGTYAPGSQLPDEMTICQQFDCSRMTVKKAYDMLVQEGFIYRKQGLGSFVLSKNMDDGEVELQERELQGFTRTARGHADTKLLHFKLVFAPKDIADHLGIRENDPLYDILRVRNIDGEPYVLEHTYMSPETIPGITEDILKHSVYTYIEDVLGKKIASAQKTTRAQISNPQDQAELGLRPEEPVLEVEQIAYLDNGTPFEYSISRHRYDRFKLSVYSVRR